MDPSQQDVAIFWDFENCRPASQSSGHDVTDAIRRLAHTFGTVKSFKAYLDISECLPSSSISTKTSVLRSQLQSSGVSLIDCPHNGQKDVADMMMIVDMMSYAMDASPTSTTLIVITADRDFSYVLSVLRLRRFPIVLITKDSAAMCLKSRGSVCYDWNTDILEKESSLDTCRPGAFGGVNSSGRPGVTSSRRSSSFSFPSAFPPKPTQESSDGFIPITPQSLLEPTKPLYKPPFTHRATMSSSDANSEASGNCFSPASFLVGSSKQLPPTPRKSSVLGDAAWKPRRTSVSSPLGMPRGLLDVPPSGKAELISLPPDPIEEHTPSDASEQNAALDESCHDTQLKGKERAVEPEEAPVLMKDDPEPILVHPPVQTDPETTQPCDIVTVQDETGEMIDADWSPSIVSVDSLVDDCSVTDNASNFDTAKTSAMPLPSVDAPSRPEEDHGSAPIPAASCQPPINDIDSTQSFSDEPVDDANLAQQTPVPSLSVNPPAEQLPDYPAKLSFRDVALKPPPIPVDAPSTSTSTPDPVPVELKPLPKGLLPLIEALERHTAKDDPSPYRSTMEKEVMAADKNVLYKAGVRTFPQYCALAEYNKIAKMSHGKRNDVCITLNDWKSLYIDPRKKRSKRVPITLTTSSPVSFITPSASSSSSSNLPSSSFTWASIASHYGIAPSTLERHFLPAGVITLIEILERYLKNHNEPRPLCSRVALDIIGNGGNIYAQANLTRFKQYCAVAESAEIIQFGSNSGQPGTEWVTLLEWRKRYYDPRLLAVVRLEFEPLVQCLERYRKIGISKPLRSNVATELVTQANAVYKQAGVTKFAEYSQLAVEAKVVIMGGTQGEAWIAFNPEWHTKYSSLLG